MRITRWRNMGALTSTKPVGEAVRAADEQLAPGDLLAGVRHHPVALNRPCAPRLRA
jgi:hypothetical protein